MLPAPDLWKGFRRGQRTRLHLPWNGPVIHNIDEEVALADRVVVFTSRLGRIKAVVPIDMPRPRDPFSPAAEALRRQLTGLLQDEVDRAFVEQEALPA